MRILQVHTRYRERGGENEVVDEEARLLRTSGHTVQSQIFENSSSNWSAAAQVAIAPWNPLAASTIARTARSFRPEVAHIHNTWFAASPSIVRALDKAGVPIVMTLHNFRLVCANGLLYRDIGICEDCVGDRPWHAVRHACYRSSRLQSIPAAATIALAQALRTWSGSITRFIALSRFAREIMVRGGLPAEKVVVGSNFVRDPGRRDASPSSSSTVLFVGRLSEEKGVRFLVETWRAAHTGLQLAIVGDGHLRDELAARPDDSVTLLGTLDHDRVTELMKSSRALVFPSLSYEGQPRVILEAMAAGIPVGVSNVGALAEIGPAATASPGVSDEWADLLRRFTSDDYVNQAGQAARQAYLASYTPEQAAANLESTYRSTVTTG